MVLLKVSEIRKLEGDNPVLQNINFTQQYLQKIAIAGASGSGKSTLLKIIAGLIQADAGEVLFDNKGVKGPYEKLIPGHPEIAYLSQHFELRNNYRVEELLAYANTLLPSQAATLYDVCRIGHLLKRRTDALSGGEKQRIALARLLTASPKLLLLDEPFSGLDVCVLDKVVELLLQVSISAELKPLIIVSHDIETAIAISDTVFILGTEKDKPGATIKKEINLIERDLAWKQDIKKEKNFIETVEEIKTCL